MLKPTQIALVAMVLLSAAMPVSAGNEPKQELSMSVMGLQLGAPLDAVECAPAKYLPTSYASVYEQPVTPCWMHLSKPGTPLGTDERINLALASDAIPRGVKGQGISGLIVDGRLEYLRLFTNGSDYQNILAKALSDKFGAPSDAHTSPVETRAGATFDNLTATWRAPNLTVSLYGIAGSVDFGYIEIGTPKGYVKLAELEDAKHQTEAKF